MATQTIHIPAAVREALQRGQVIEAIRLLRDSSGLDLRTAKEAVDALQRHGGGITPESQRGQDSPGGVAPATGDGHAREMPLPPDVVAALSQGNVIEAIKRLRAAQPMQLRDAKALVDRHRHAATSHYSLTVAPGDRSGRQWWWVLLVLTAFVAWAWWRGRG